MIFFVILGIFFVVSLIWAWIDAILDDNRAQRMEDFNHCYGCNSGWCMLTPDSDECKEWREKNGKT